jgi:uncharacterized protein
VNSCQRRIAKLKQLFGNDMPIVAILGPRQCGKTTLAKQYALSFKLVHHFDLERPSDLNRLENPIITLGSLKGLIIIDEIQRPPDLFPILRVLIDEQKSKQKFLILGSASRELIQQSSESLAGRITYLELGGFNTEEVDLDENKLWFRGGFPKSFLAKSEQASFQWRESFITTFLEQDIPQLGISIPSGTLRKFWSMMAHYHGQTWNASELGRAFGVSDTTVKRYLDILTGTFMMRQLQPWQENIGKRIVKAPKVYFRDSGIYHALLEVESIEALIT